MQTIITTCTVVAFAAGYLQSRGIIPAWQAGALVGFALLWAVVMDRLTRR